ncbi:hypothetical protein DESC_720024 [Desulfosarcina cetonica]|nr:hypothetical protein DESC_720024 [Desulfosarcina cetonica]
MGQIETDKPDDEQGKRRCHGPMNAHGADPHDEGVERPGDQEKSHIGVAEGVDLVIIQHPDDPQRDPERAIGNKGTVTEIIAAFELLKARDQLGDPAKGNRKGQNRSDPTPPKVMELENQCG